MSSVSKLGLMAMLGMLSLTSTVLAGSPGDHFSVARASARAEGDSQEEKATKVKEQYENLLLQIRGANYCGVELCRNNPAKVCIVVGLKTEEDRKRAVAAFKNPFILDGVEVQFSIMGAVEPF